jgi:putative intracellular protease/amidase
MKLVYELPFVAAAPRLLSGMQVLVAVPAQGGMDPLIVFPLAALRAHGATVTVATVDGGRARGEFVGALLGLFHAPRRSVRAFALERRARRERWLDAAASLAALERDRGGAERLAAGFDAIVAPGGRAGDPLLQRLLAAAARAGKLVALQFTKPWRRSPHVIVNRNLISSLGAASAELLGAVLVDELALRIAERAAVLRLRFAA